MVQDKSSAGNGYRAQAAPDPDQARMQGLVAQAFVLGWHVAELYRLDLVTQPSPAAAVSGSIPPPLPGVGDLQPAERQELLIRQLKHDLDGLWELADAPPRQDLDSRLDVIAQADPHTFSGLVEDFHRIVLGGMTVADFRLGKSYGLARALAEATIVPDATSAGEELRESLDRCFSTEAVFGMQASLLDLRDWYAANAADAVSTTLGAWSLWTVRPTIDGTNEVDWRRSRHVDSVRHALRRQGDMWRGLLSGEKNPKNIIGAEYYFGAMVSVLKHVARLALQFLGTAIGLILFLFVVVAGLALYFASTSNSTTGVLAAVVALLSSLGVTTGSVGASVKRAWSKAEDPLWAAEVSQAVAQAAWQNPAPLGSIEQIQLLTAIGEDADPEAAARARHPNLSLLRNVPVGRLGVVLMVVSIFASLFAADAGRLDRDASLFLLPLCIVAFLAIVDGWDLLIGLAARQAAPFVSLPERISLPAWIMPVAQWLAPVFLVSGLLAGHFFWH